MFKNMGMPNGMLALYTSLLYLPWVIKPLWSPFVDIIKSKRWWIVTMQILMTIAMLALPCLLPQTTGEAIVQTPLFFVTLALFWVTAFASATPLDTAFNLTNAEFVLLAMIFARVVLPVPGGP